MMNAKPETTDAAQLKELSIDGIPDLPALAAQPPTPMTLIELGVQRGASIEQLAQLMELQERWERNEARKAYTAAMNAFKANPPELTKNKFVSFATSRGKTEYRHATLDQVSGIIGEALSKYGLSHRWEVEQLDGGRIRVTCVLTHDKGHSERVSITGSPDESGSKNPIQAIGSAVTYLQRYTLLAATGLAVKDGSDDDGRGGTGTHEMDAGQAADFRAAIEALEDRKQAEALWRTIASECTRVGDVGMYAELKSLIATKVKGLPK